MGEMSKLELGVFLPIGNNGFLMSKTAPQYKPSFEMNKQIAILAESFGFDFVFSMSKWRGFGGETRLLGLDAGIACADDRSRRRDLADRHHRDDSAASCFRRGGRQDGRDHRRREQRPLRHQHRDRLVSRRIRADGRAAGRLQREALPICRGMAPCREAAVDRRFGDLRWRVVPSEGLPVRAASGAEAVPQHHLRRHVRRRIPVHRERGQLQLPQRHHRRPYQRAEPADESDRCRIWPGDQDRDDAVADRRRDAGGS